MSEIRTLDLSVMEPTLSLLSYFVFTLYALLVDLAKLLVKSRPNQMSEDRFLLKTNVNFVILLCIILIIYKV